MSSINIKAPLKKQISDVYADYIAYVNEMSSTDVDEESYLKAYSQELTISAWIRDFRPQADNIFIGLTDGSTVDTLQVFASKSVLPEMEDIENIRGACVKVSGHVVKSPAKGQIIELVASKINIISVVEDKKSIILSKKVNLETLRSFQHLRSRFRSYANIYKIRSTLLKNIHKFFHANNFYNLDPNVITTSDCEGAGEVFTITSLDIDETRKKIIEESAKMCEASDSEEKLKILSSSQEHKILTKDLYEDDFFGKKAFLTVSSQLQLEALVAGLSRVYTLNPSFRAERSKTKRHLACFQHLEFEIAFIDINDLMNFSESLVKFVIGSTLVECDKEYKELDSFMSKGIRDKLNSFINCDFERITYSKAIDLIESNKKDILKKFNKEGMTIKDIPNWGDDLGSFCERFICEEIYKKPTFIHNYPKDLKSFYMKETESDPRCVDAVDLCVPYMGELIGSSIRENSYEKLCTAMEKRGMDKSKLKWYTDLRKTSNGPTGGAGLGFDRLVNMCTLMDGNIRDVVPFPVSYQECDY
jgi:asparaginyl-tRNA synthetase